MRLSLILLVVAATLLAICDAASAVHDQTVLLMAEASNVVKPNHAIMNNKEERILRAHDTSAGDEERTVNLNKLFDFKKWFGMGKNSAANNAIRKSTASNNAVRKENTFNRVTRNHHTVNTVSNVDLADDFATVNVDKMLTDPAFEEKMFKTWDSYKMDDIRFNIGHEKLNENAVAKMIVDYAQNRRDYSKWGPRPKTPQNPMLYV